MTVTDCITFLLSFFFIILGSSRGFMRSLLGPFSIIIASIISIIYYQITKDTVISLLIGIIGPLLLTFLLKFLLHSWAVATNTNTKPHIISRLGGAALTLIWGWVFIIFTLILLALIPPWSKALTSVHDDMKKSISYSIAKPLGKILFTAKENVNTTVKDLNPDAKSLSEDPRFQKILQDPEIQKEIDAHDIVKLMSNPKMMELTRQIMNDPDTMKKVLAIYSSQKQMNFSGQGSAK